MTEEEKSKKEVKKVGKKLEDRMKKKETKDDG